MMEEIEIDSEGQEGRGDAHEVTVSLCPRDDSMIKILIHGSGASRGAYVNPNDIIKAYNALKGEEE